MKSFQKVAFIGAGSMAEAIISGLISKEVLSPEQIYATNKSDHTRLQRLQNRFEIFCNKNKQEVIQDAGAVILAMKPKDVTDALTSVKPYITSDQLVISVLAGVSTDYISGILETEAPVVRAMPNTSAAVGYSATAIAQGKTASSKHVEQTKSLFQAIGTTTVVAEDNMHAVTGLSGSGPAYIYYLVEAMEQTAAQFGLEQDISQELILQTLAGAYEMLKTTKERPSILRENITSPGGTTEAGLETLQEYDYQKALMECIRQAAARSEELGSQFTLQKEKIN